MKFSLIETPKCPNCGVHMKHRTLAFQTPEQKYCGAWYDCPAPGCACSALIPSAALAQMYKKAGKPIHHPNLPD